MNPYENKEKLDKLFKKLNSIAHDRAGLFDTPIVNEVYKIIEEEKEQAIEDFVVGMETEPDLDKNFSRMVRIWWEDRKNFSKFLKETNEK